MTSIHNTGLNAKSYKNDEFENSAASSLLHILSVRSVKVLMYSKDKICKFSKEFV